MATDRFEANDSTHNSNDKFNKFFNHMKFVMDNARRQYREKKVELRKEAGKAQKNVEAGKGGIKERVRAAALNGASTVINALSPDNHLYLGKEMKGEMAGLVLHRDKKSGGFYMEAIRPVVIPGIDGNKDIKLKQGDQTGLYMLEGKQSKQDFANAINNDKMNIFVEHGAKLEIKDNLIDPIKTLGSRARVMDQSVLSVGKEANVNRTTIKGKSIVSAVREMSGNDIENSSINVDGNVKGSKIKDSHINGVGGVDTSTIDNSDIYVENNNPRMYMISSSTVTNSNVNNTSRKNRPVHIFRGTVDKSYLVDTSVLDSDVSKGYVTGSDIDKSTLMLGQNNNNIENTKLSNTVVDDKGKIIMKNCTFDHSYVNGTRNNAKQFEGVTSKLAAYADTVRFANSNLEGSYRKNKAGNTVGVRTPIFKNTTGSNLDVKARRVSHVYTSVDLGNGTKLRDTSYVPDHRDESMDLSAVDHAYAAEQKKFEKNFLFGTDMPIRQYDTTDGHLITVDSRISEALDDRNARIAELFTETDDMISKGNIKAQRYNADRGRGNVVSLTDWKNNIPNNMDHMLKIRTNAVKTPTSTFQEVRKTAEAVINKPKLQKDPEKAPKVVDIKDYRRESSNDGPEL